MAAADAQTPATFVDTADNAVDKTVSLGSSITVGNVLVLILGTQGHDPSSCTVTDNLGNTWTTAQSDTYLDPHGVAYFKAPVTVGGACTATVHKGGVITDIACRLHEISGWDGTTFLDGTAVTGSGTGTNAGLTMSATSVTTDFLITAIAGDPASAFTPGTPASGFGALTNLNNEACFVQLSEATRTPAATGTFSAGYPSMTNAGANKWAVLAFAIKGIPAVVPPGPPVLRRQSQVFVNEELILI